MSGKRTCKGTTKAGQPCTATPLNEGTVIEGVAVAGGYCRSHDPDLAAAGIPKVPASFGGVEHGRLGGRPRKPRAIDVLKERMEQDIDQVLAPLFEALRAEKSVVVGQGPTAHVETVPDIPTRIAAARELLDRGYGRPKQVVDAVVVTDEDLLERIALIEEQGLVDPGFDSDVAGG